MSTSSEREMRWIDAWNDMYDIIGTRWHVDCLLPDGSVVDTDTCQGWLQDSAYDDYQLKVESGWVNGKRGILASRFMEKSSEVQ
jgi:hypothetical protein